MNIFQKRKQLLKFCRLLYDKGLLTAMDGNVSVRLENGAFLTTPSGRNKGLIEEQDLVQVDSNGEAVESDKRPSSEFRMHLRVYEHREDVNAVVHCHPVYATVFASSSMELDSCLLTESIVAFGQVPKAPVALPSTNEIPDSITPFLQQTNLILLSNHGALSYGESLEVAFSRMEALEHFAKISYLTRLAGFENPVKGQTVDQLEGLRAGYGMHDSFIPCNRESGTKEKLDEDAIVAEVLKQIRLK